MNPAPVPPTPQALTPKAPPGMRALPGMSPETEKVLDAQIRIRPEEEQNPGVDEPPEEPAWLAEAKARAKEWEKEWEARGPAAEAVRVFKPETRTRPDDPEHRYWIPDG